MTKKNFLIAGALLAGLGVALGAVGSHAWKDVLAQNSRTETYETAVRYQLYHAMALLIIGVLADKDKPGLLNKVSLMFISGVVLFSGSLYALLSQYTLGCLCDSRWWYTNDRRLGFVISSPFQNEAIKKPSRFFIGRFL